MTSQFWIEESQDSDGSLRLTLFGELDLTVVGELESRLGELKAEETPHVSPVVKRPLELLGLGEVLWSKTPD